MTTISARRSLPTAIIAAAFFPVVTGVASASVFFSTNRNTDELVRINSNTGGVTTVGGPTSVAPGGGATTLGAGGPTTTGAGSCLGQINKLSPVGSIRGP